MARPKRIRISKNDKQEYQRLVRNAKAKLSRTQKKYGIDLSDIVELPPLDFFETREEFNEFKENIRSFTNRNNLHFQYVKNEEGVVASKAEILQMERVTKRAQNLADEMSKEGSNLPFFTGDGKSFMTVGQREAMFDKPTLGFTRPRDFNFADIKTRNDFERMFESRRLKGTRQYYREKSETMRDNFANIIELSFNSEGEELANMIRGLPPEDFYDIYRMFSEWDFENFDSDGGMTDNGKTEKMMGEIEKYYRDNLAGDLKGF